MTKILFQLRQVTIATIITIVASSCFSDRELPPPPKDIEERKAALLELETNLALLEKMNAEEASGLLDHDDYRVRQMAARHMGTLGDSSKHFLNELVFALKDENKLVRLEAAISLGSVGDEKAIEPLILSLADEDPRVRLWTWKSLRNFGNPAITAMIPHMGEASATKKLAYTDESGGKRSLRHEIATRFPTLGRKALPFVIEGLDNEDVWVMRHCITILGEMEKASINALPRLIEILETSTNNSEKVRVVRALGKIGDLHPSVMPALEAAASHGNKKVKKEAKRVLKEFSKASKGKKSEGAKKRMEELRSRKTTGPNPKKPGS